MINLLARQRKIGVILSYINIFLQTIANFIYVPLLLYYIGKSEYGLYQLMGSMIAYFSIMDFGLSAMVVRFYARYRALADKVGMENILAIARRAYAVIVMVMLIIGFSVYPFLSTVFSNSMNASEMVEATWIYIFLLLNQQLLYLQKQMKNYLKYQFY